MISLLSLPLSQNFDMLLGTDLGVMEFFEKVNYNKKLFCILHNPQRKVFKIQYNYMHNSDLLKRKKKLNRTGIRKVWRMILNVFSSAYYRILLTLINYLNDSIICENILFVFNVASTLYRHCSTQQFILYCFFNRFFLRN